MRTQIEQIVDGIRYDTEKAQIIAHNEYWDGSNFERGGRNFHLYQSPNGRYFAGYSTQWQDERNYIEPMSKSEAMDMYEALPEHPVSYEDAFDETPEEA